MAQVEFGGRIGRDWRDSEPWWPPVPKPPEGAPNVVLIVLDDVGFAQLGCYGSDMDTPVLDGLADRGVRLANFHTTALCSPTRACLLTGRTTTEVPWDGWPTWPSASPVTGASRLGRTAPLGDPAAHGYATYAIGKWHLTPEDETNMAASRGTWPLGRGFDRWYGFHGGETHQFMPALFHDNHVVRPPRSFEEGYHLERRPADHAIEFLGDCAPSTRSNRSSSISAPGRATRRIKRPQSGSSTTAATSPGDGTGGGNRPIPGSSSWGSSRRVPNSRRAPHGSRPGTPSAISGANWPSGSWSASQRSCHIPTRRSAGSSTSSTTWGTRRTPS